MNKERPGNAFKLPSAELNKNPITLKTKLP